jgi:hypothetical protein
MNSNGLADYPRSLCCLLKEGPNLIHCGFQVSTDAKLFDTDIENS